MRKFKKQRLPIPPNFQNLGVLIKKLETAIKKFKQKRIRSYCVNPPANKTDVVVSKLSFAKKGKNSRTRIRLVRLLKVLVRAKKRLRRHANRGWIIRPRNLRIEHKFARKFIKKIRTRFTWTYTKKLIYAFPKLPPSHLSSLFMRRPVSTRRLHADIKRVIQQRQRAILSYLVKKALPRLGRFIKKGLFRVKYQGLVQGPETPAIKTFFRNLAKIGKKSSKKNYRLKPYLFAWRFGLLPNPHLKFKRRMVRRMAAISALVRLFCLQDRAIASRTMTRRRWVYRSKVAYKIVKCIRALKIKERSRKLLSHFIRGRRRNILSDYLNYRALVSKIVSPKQDDRPDLHSHKEKNKTFTSQRLIRRLYEFQKDLKSKHYRSFISKSGLLRSMVGYVIDSRLEKIDSIVGTHIGSKTPTLPKIRKFLVAKAFKQLNRFPFGNRAGNARWSPSISISPSYGKHGKAENLPAKSFLDMAEFSNPREVRYANQYGKLMPATPRGPNAPHLAHHFRMLIQAYQPPPLKPSPIIKYTKLTFQSIRQKNFYKYNLPTRAIPHTYLSQRAMHKFIIHPVFRLVTISEEGNAIPEIKYLIRKSSRRARTFDFQKSNNFFWLAKNFWKSNNDRFNRKRMRRLFVYGALFPKKMAELLPKLALLKNIQKKIRAGLLRQALKGVSRLLLIGSTKQVVQKRGSSFKFRSVPTSFFPLNNRKTSDSFEREKAIQAVFGLKNFHEAVSRFKALGGSKILVKIKKKRKAIFRAAIPINKDPLLFFRVKENNFFLTLTSRSGKVKAVVSGGSVEFRGTKFRGTKKFSAHATYQATQKIIRKALSYKIRKVRLIFLSPRGPHTREVIRALAVHDNRFSVSSVSIRIRPPFSKGPRLPRKRSVLQLQCFVILAFFLKEKPPRVLLLKSPRIQNLKNKKTCSVL